MIKQLREKKGLTQSELAKKIGLSRSHVNRMERKVSGYRASYSTIKMLSKELEECPLKIFLFFANIDCKYIKLTSEFKNVTTCTIKACFENNKTKGVRRISRENKKLKKRLKIKTFKNNL